MPKAPCESDHRLQRYLRLSESPGGGGVLLMYKVPRECQHLGCVFHQKRKRKGVFFFIKMQEKGYTEDIQKVMC